MKSVTSFYMSISNKEELELVNKLNVFSILNNISKKQAFLHVLKEFFETHPEVSTKISKISDIMLHSSEQKKSKKAKEKSEEKKK